MITKILASHSRVARSAFYYLHDKFEPTVERVSMVEFHGFDAAELAGFELGVEGSHDALAKRVSTLMRRTADAALGGPVGDFAVPITMAIHPDDRLAEGEWSTVAERMIKHLGLGDHQVLIVRHSDTDHDHIHLLANRVSVEGYLWDEWYSKLNSAYLSRTLEREYGLRELSMKRSPHLALTYGEMHEVERTYLPPLIEVARERLPVALEVADSWDGFARGLGEAGLWLEPGKYGGAVVTNGERRVKLSRVLPGRDPLGQIEAALDTSFVAYREDLGDRPLGHYALEYAVEPHAFDHEGLMEAADRVLDKLTRHELSFTGEQIEQAARAFPHAKTVLAAAMRSERLVALGDGRYTTAEYLVLEDRFLLTTEKLKTHKETIRVPGLGLEAALESHPELSADQRSVLEGLQKSPSDLFAVQGISGSGKTHVLGVVREMYEASGHKVVGLGPTHRSRSAMVSVDIEATTVASFVAKGEASLGRDTLVILDEASMVGLVDFDRLLREVERSGAQLLAIGDRGQIQPVSAGAPFRNYLEPDVELTEVRRQSVDWMRDATTAFYRGDIEGGLAAYANRGRLHYWGTNREALESLSEAYVASVVSHPEARQVAVAYTLEDRDWLNRDIRQRLLAEGHLQPAAGFDIEVAVNERIIFERTDKTGSVVVTLQGEGVGVSKGDYGTVVGFDEGERTLDVALDSGRVIRFRPEDDPEVWGRAFSGQAFDAGFGGNVHRLQAASFDRVFMFADSRLRREAFYVEATRHKEDLHIFADRSAFDPPAYRAMQTLEHDWADNRTDLAAALGKQLAQEFSERGRGKEILARALVANPAMARDVNREVRRALGHKTALVKGEPVTWLHRDAAGEPKRRFGAVVAVDGDALMVRSGGARIELDAPLVSPAYALTSKEWNPYRPSAIPIDRLHYQAGMRLTDSGAKALQELSDEGVQVRLWANRAEFPQDVRVERQWRSMVWHFSRQTEDPALRELAAPELLEEALARTATGQQLEEVRREGERLLHAHGVAPELSATEALEAAKDVITRAEISVGRLAEASVSFDGFLGEIYAEPAAARLQLEHARASHEAQEVRQALQRTPQQFGALVGADGSRQRSDALRIASVRSVDFIGYDNQRNSTANLVTEAEGARERLPVLLREARGEERHRALFAVGKRSITVEDVARAETTVDRYRFATHQVAFSREALERAAGAVYRDPVQAAGALVDLVQAEGSDIAAELLRVHPERVSELRGVEVSGGRVRWQADIGRRLELERDLPQLLALERRQGVASRASLAVPDDRLAVLNAEVRGHLGLSRDVFEVGEPVRWQQDDGRWAYGVVERQEVGQVVVRTDTSARGLERSAVSPAYVLAPADIEFAGPAARWHEVTAEHGEPLARGVRRLEAVANAPGLVIPAEVLVRHVDERVELGELHARAQKLLRAYRTHGELKLPGPLNVLAAAALTRSAQGTARSLAKQVAWGYVAAKLPYPVYQVLRFGVEAVRREFSLEHQRDRGHSW